MLWIPEMSGWADASSLAWFQAANKNLACARNLMVPQLC